MARSFHICLPDGRRLDFTILVSGRRKTVALKLTGDGLVITAPQGLDDGRITEIVGWKSNWIMRKLQELDQVSHQVGGPAPLRPESLDLPALAESWRVEYRETGAGGVTAWTEEPGRTLVYGAVSNLAMCQAVLPRWLALRAEEAMEVRLDLVAKETGIRFQVAAGQGCIIQWVRCPPGKV